MSKDKQLKKPIFFQNRVHSSVPILQRQPSEPPPDLRLLRLRPGLRPLHDPLLSIRRLPRQHLHDVRTSGISSLSLISNFSKLLNPYFGLLVSSLGASQFFFLRDNHIV